VELGLQVLQELAIVVAEQAVQVSWSQEHQQVELILVHHQDAQDQFLMLQTVHHQQVLIK